MWFHSLVQVTRQFTEVLRKRLAEPLNFIQVVIGPRQVGKTTGLRQIVATWPSPIRMVSADDVSPPSADWIEMNWRMARAMGHGAVLAIDEIQKVPGWSAVVKRLFDADRADRALKVVLMGSASLTLQQGLADSLAGRYELIRAEHWNLAECHEAFGWNLDTFLKFGGYPGAAELTHDVPRWRAFVRDAIVEPVLIKDLLAFAFIAKPALFRQTFDLAMAYPAQEVSLQKLLGQLQEAGNVSTIKHYLDVFESAFLLRTLRKFTGSTVRSRASMPKLLPMNTALVHALHDPSEMDRSPEWYGHVLEAAVGAALCREPHRVSYWREGRDEVDFVVEADRMLYAVEVKSGRTKRATGLAAFCRRYPDAIPAMVDRAAAERLLRGEPLASVVSSAR